MRVTTAVPLALVVIGLAVAIGMHHSPVALQRRTAVKPSRSASRRPGLHPSRKSSSDRLLVWAENTPL